MQRVCVGGCRPRLASDIVDLRSQRSRHHRKGFTIVELLVSIAVIAVLVSLILPAVQSARQASHRAQCASRLRNVGLGLLKSAETHRRFPAAALMAEGVDKEHPIVHENWVVAILPFLDRVNLSDRWKENRISNPAANAELSTTYVDVLVCPSDITVERKGDLSFAVNGGVGESVYRQPTHDFPVDPFYNPIDLNGNQRFSTPSGADPGLISDRDILKAVGMFFVENFRYKDSPGYAGTVRYHTPASIVDGMTNTLLVTENVRTGYDPYEPGATWASADTRRSRVYFSHRICRGNSCRTGQVDYSRANFGTHAINAALTQAEGEAPWPSSFHPGGVNAVFADGHLRFVNEEIDGLVYASLFSPAGQKLNELPLDQSLQQAY